MSALTIVMAQQDFLVGAIEANTRKVIETALQARNEHQADLVVFPELCLTGYPPEDLLLRPSLEGRIRKAMDEIAAAVTGVDVLVGMPLRDEEGLRNAVGWLSEGRWCCIAYKQKLPNYLVFDEHRYFVPAAQGFVHEWRGHRVGISICEDIWWEAPAVALKGMGADFIISMNASPFYNGKQADRYDLVMSRAKRTGLPVLYVNLVGGQDELVFDGGSFAMQADGELAVVAPSFEEGLYPVRLGEDGTWEKGPVAESLSEEARVYRALVLGVRDYVNKNGFPGVVLGLSGGIDSGLVVAIAVDALGPERVHAVMMPYQYTSTMSLEDAEAGAKALGIRYDVAPIAPMVEAFMGQLAPFFQGMKRDATEENLQSRARGVMLMALSNKTGAMVLTTGNKSEMAVGYATLYGDMAGGYDVLKDVYKTLVFRLARYRNSLSPVIPERVITRPPSAELAPDQKDSDSLPDYPVLDAILYRYIEQDLSGEQIVADGFDRATVWRVLRLVDRNEYKRRQAPIGVRISQRGFGRDRRYPITNGWVIGE